MAINQLEVVAQSILFLMPPSIQPPFQVRLGVQTNGSELLSKGDFTVANCQDIADAVQKVLQLIEEMGLKIAPDFVLVLPPFVGRNEAEEAIIIDRAWSIKDAADNDGWEFSRNLPPPIF